MLKKKKKNSETEVYSQE